MREPGTPVWGSNFGTRRIDVHPSRAERFRSMEGLSPWRSTSRSLPQRRCAVSLLAAPLPSATRRMLCSDSSDARYWSGGALDAPGRLESSLRSFARSLRVLLPPERREVQRVVSGIAHAESSEEKAPVLGPGKRRARESRTFQEEKSEEPGASNEAGARFCPCSAAQILRSPGLRGLPGGPGSGPSSAACRAPPMRRALCAARSSRGWTAGA